MATTKDDEDQVTTGRVLRELTAGGIAPITTLKLLSGL